MPEYMAMCEEYGIELTEEHIQTVKAIANDNGEVRDLALMSPSTDKKSTVNKIFHFKQNLQVRKNDFIYHIKASNMFSLFESIDPDSHSRWQTLAGLDFSKFNEINQLKSIL